MRRYWRARQRLAETRPTVAPQRRRNLGEADPGAFAERQSRAGQYLRALPLIGRRAIALAAGAFERDAKVVGQAQERRGQRDRDRALAGVGTRGRDELVVEVDRQDGAFAGPIRRDEQLEKSRVQKPAIVGDGWETETPLAKSLDALRGRQRGEGLEILVCQLCPCRRARDRSLLAHQRAGSGPQQAPERDEIAGRIDDDVELVALALDPDGGRSRRELRAGSRRMTTRSSPRVVSKRGSCPRAVRRMPSWSAAVAISGETVLCAGNCTRARRGSSAMASTIERTPPMSTSYEIRVVGNRDDIGEIDIVAAGADG